MKRILSIFLVFSMGISIVGFYPVFMALQYQARQEIKMRIKQGIPYDEIHKIAFALNEKVDWERKDKEFRLNDQMYDIVKKEYKGGQVIYYCINDLEEEDLFADLDELTKKQMNENSGKSNAARLLLKIFTQTYIPVEPCPLSTITISSKVFFHYEFTVTPVDLETETRPPDLG